MDCDKNCEFCVYEDCVCTSKDYSDIDFADRLIDKELDQEFAKMKAIENGTYETYKYNHSEKGKAAQKRYIQSDKGKAAQKRYRQSEKGKAVEKRKTQKRITSGKNAEYCRNYYYRKKARKRKMAKLFRFSGYYVDYDKYLYEKEEFNKNLLDMIAGDGIFQQLHIEESESFELDGEEKENCDLALLTRHFKKDSTDMQFDRPLPVAGQKYKHFKLGKIVTVIGISRHTETEEVTVVYEYEGMIWNRPLEMFMSEVDHEKYPDAKQKYRFELAAECKDCEYMISGDYTKSCTNNIVRSLIWHGEKPFDENKPCPYYEPKKNRK